VRERHHSRHPQDPAASTWLHDVLLDLASRPGKVLRMWNWKSAALSIILRGPNFSDCQGAARAEFAFASARKIHGHTSSGEDAKQSLVTWVSSNEDLEEASFWGD